MNKLIPRISGYGDYTRAYAQTHVYKISVYKGFQWALFVATVVNDVVSKGPPCVYVHSNCISIQIKGNKNSALRLCVE